jgi:beta-lactamase superfamily II metal-dependent hydrolase
MFSKASFLRRSFLLSFASLAACFVCLCFSQSAARAASSLQIYWIDVEGGGATLIVSPSGESMLVDTGNPPPAGERDTKRIYQAIQLAGLKKIDYLFTTHYDGDHVGGALPLSKMIRIDKFVDHGDIDAAWNQNPHYDDRWQEYLSASSNRRMIVKPGDIVPLKGVRVQVIASNGEVLAKPINGGGLNPYCKDAEQKAPDKTENSRAAGFLLTYGKFTFLDVGDLTWDKEMTLACPVNKLGHVTLYQATHHGFYHAMSGAPAHVWGIQPQIVVVNNGPKKGLENTATYDELMKIQGLEGLWQLHLSLLNDKEHNTKEGMIANMEPTDKCQGHWIKAEVEFNGKVTITNGRNGFSQSYQAR